MYSAERHFVATAHAQLRLIASTNGQSEGEKQPAFDIAISQIKQAAAPVKARAVYRAALLCEDVLKRYSASNIKFRTALARLNSLVALYTEGLLEIDPEFKPILNGDAPKNTASPAQTFEEPPTERLKAANQNAADVLRPLLRLVKDEGQAGALAFISGYNAQASSKPNAQRANVRFDTIMRQVTNGALGVARAKAKNVSISYGADFETLDASIALDMQTLLRATCAEIVRTGLVVSGDLVSSLTRNWRISLTGKTRGQSLEIKLEWHGQALPQFTPQSLQALQNLGGQMTAKTKQQARPDDKAGLVDAGACAQILTITCPLNTSGKFAEKEKTLPLQHKSLIGEERIARAGKG